MSNSYLQELSLATGLPYFPQHSMFGNKGALIGTLDGILTMAGLGKHNNSSAVQVLFRFPEAAEDNVRAALEGAKGSFSKLEIESTSALAAHTYTFGKPKAEAAGQDIRAMAAALKSATPGFQGKCELCKTSSAGMLLCEGVPGYYCSACQERTRSEQEIAAMEYANQDSNLFGGLLLGSGAALLGSLAWGIVAYLINYIFLYGAVLIGLLVAKGVQKGMGKINTVGQALTAVLTVASVLFGDAIFYTLTLMKQEGIPFSMELLGAVLANFWQIETSDSSGIISILFALVGAGYVLYTNRKPQFEMTFEPLGEPERSAQARGAGAD